MKQVHKAEMTVFRSGKSARVDVTSVNLKKFVGKKVIVKIFSK